MKDKDIVKHLIQLWTQEKVNPLICIIWYGSRHPESDIDLFLIRQSDTSWRNASMGRLDLTCMGANEFTNNVMKFDPRVTEPLLTGEVVFGDVELINKIKGKLHNMNPNEETIKYLLELSMEQYLSSASFLNTFTHTGDFQFVLYSLINLGFAFTSRVIAHKYANSVQYEPLTIQKLIAEEGQFILRELWDFIREKKRYPMSLQISDVIKYQDIFRNFLLQ